MENQCSCGDKEILKANLKVYCDTCSNVVYRKHYAKPFKAAAIGALVCYGSLNFFEYAVTDNRYPLKTEYAILEACTNPNQKPVTRYIYGNRQKICLCALEDTMNEISHLRYLVNKSSFISAFEDNAKSCS